MKLQSWWSAASGRLLGTFLRAPGDSRLLAWLSVAFLALVLGISDFYSGLEISLSIFYLIPITLATGWLGWPAGVAVAVGCTAIRLASDILTAYPHRLPTFLVWNVAAAFVIFLFVVWVLNSLLTLHRQLEEKVEERTNELRASVAERTRLELEVLDVTMRERSAVGRELHDELGQHLVATALAAQVLAHKLNDGVGGSDAQAIVRWIEEGIAKTRKLARGLLLAQIDPERLLQELEELTVTASQAGVPCRLLHQGREIEADARACAQLFRIAQEAVGNALRHAHAAALHITLASDDHALCLTVEDDGCGLPLDRAPTAGMGLRIMAHRAKIIGASLSVISAPGEGTRVICQLPKRVPLET